MGQEMTRCVSVSLQLWDSAGEFNLAKMCRKLLDSMRGVYLKKKKKLYLSLHFVLLCESAAPALTTAACHVF